MVLSSTRLTSTVPIGYQSPSFPSLYWPINPSPSHPRTYLYHSKDIWKFTLFWTLLVYASFHLAAGIWAFLVAPSKRAVGWPVVYLLVGGVEATMAGSIVGLILAAVYNAGYFSMSTWIPFVWSIINILVLLLSSFSLQGGL